MRVHIVVALPFVCVFVYGARTLAQHQNPPCRRLTKYLAQE